MKKVPKLRFKEFVDEWKEKKIENIVEVNPRIEELPDEFIYIDLESVENGVLKEKKIIQKENAPSRAKRNVKLNDILYQTVRPYQQNNLFFNFDDEFEYIASTGYAQLRSTENNSKYIYHMLHTKKFLDKVLERCTGTSYPAINSNDLSEINIFYSPFLEEQEKIADFLSAVDVKINLIENKLELLKEYKKGIMQKIFNQELRFKDSKGNDYPEWEEKKLGELPIYVSDGNYGELYPKQEELLEQGVPFIRVNNLKNSKISFKEMKYISKELHQILLSGHLIESDILVCTRGEIGIVAYVDYKFNGANINAQLCLLRIKDINIIIPHFLLHSLNSYNIQKQFKELQTGSALKQLPKKNLSKLIFNIPCLEEQQKIADFLSTIDNKIEKFSDELENLKEFKKGLLQQMFV